MTAHAGLFASLTPGRLAAVDALARDVAFPAGTRIFEEDGTADRFWIIREGLVVLDLHVPGRGFADIETIGPGDLLGWSWLCPPHRWHLGARARDDVEAREYDARAVRDLCARDPELGHALVTQVAQTIGHRLRATRTRLLDLYGTGEVS